MSKRSQKREMSGCEEEAVAVEFSDEKVCSVLTNTEV